MDSSEGMTSSGATLKRPVQIVKKRSGPLEDALAELNKQEDVAAASPIKAPSTSRPSTVSRKSSTITISPPTSRRRPTIKEKEKKRERWLLTRKTWKYMTDAGRKLIPDNAQNRKEDIPKIEAHFNQVCAAEPRFMLWRRKSSYPGAMRTSKRRLKQLLQHTGQKQPPSQDAIQQEESNNADQIIELLQSYLKLDESYKTTTLLGTKTVRPDQTASPSAQRPSTSSASRQVSLRGHGFLASTPQPPKGIQQLSEIEQLLERLRALSKSATMPAITIPTEYITPAILEDKILLKKIYNQLKKQQLHRVLSKHSTPFSSTIKPRSNLTHSSSLSSLLFFGHHSAHSDDHHQTLAPIPNFERICFDSAPTAKLEATSAADTASHTLPVAPARQRKPPATLELTASVIAKKKQQPQRVEHQVNSCGTQTNFIQLHEIKRLAEEYKERKREEAAANLPSPPAGGTPAATDDEADQQQHHRRKSSIDNEDVSQSVSDTIKRYLRMARKKSVHDSNANRFKRVNYDRNLRNIRAKGEINPPGMDDGNDKAVQTLDAWPLITLDFIRGNENSGILETAHAEWQKALEERIQKKLDYEQKLQQQQQQQQENAAASKASHHKQSLSSCSSSSAPTSPTSSSDQYTHATPLTPPHGYNGSGSGTGILQTGSQFLSNLWHGNAGSSYQHKHDPTDAQASSKSSASLNSQGTTAATPDGGSKNVGLGASVAAAMQKSKSSSNVGQFVSKKILKSRSKSQNRPVAQAPLPRWTPADKYTWTSDNGGRILLVDTSIQNLSEFETKILKRVAIEKINELNIGVHLTADYEGKSQKRRVLSKKKAMTTSLFDIGKKDDQGSTSGLFGISLESCVANDKKRSSNLNALTDRGSRNSLAMLFRVGSTGDSQKLSENVRSCESLPSSSQHCENVGTTTNKNNKSSYFSSLSKSSSMQISRSQSDVRRKSQEFDVGSPYGPQITDANKGFDDQHLQVPSFINSCIKYLEEHGLHKVGLFRVSTSRKRVKQMRDDLDKNNITNIDKDTCPHDVATLLKEFLRDLPEPLLCSGLYKAFLETQSTYDLEKLRFIQGDLCSQLIRAG